MRIAIWHNLPSGGGKRALYNQVKGLIARGHMVESWCPSSADQSYLPLSELITEHVLPFDWQPKSEKRFFRYSLSKYHNMVGKMELMNRHCKQCAGEINKGNFDLLLATSCMFFGISPISRFVQIPKVIYLHEPYRKLYEAMPQLKWIALPPSKKRLSLKYIKRFIGNLIEVQCLRIQAREESTNARAFDLILVNSLFSRENILRIYGLDAKVCYLGIEIDKFVTMNKPKRKYVVGIGEFSRHKNIKFILKSLAQIAHNRPQLIWIGNHVSSSYLDELKSYATLLNVDFEPKVRIDDAELVNILSSALAMVYAPRLEPFGFAPLEANACGLPVIAVAEGGVRETVTHGANGLLVEHDPCAMAEAIQYLVSNPGHASELGQHGRKLVQDKWSLQESINRLENNLQQLVKRDIYRI